MINEKSTSIKSENERIQKAQDDLQSEINTLSVEVNEKLSNELKKL